MTPTQPTTPRGGQQPGDGLSAVYRELIDHADGHGIVGRPGPRQANTHRTDLGLPSRRPGGGPVWTTARLEAWRDTALAWLDTHLLGAWPAPTSPADQARAVLALADVAVRDTWLVRYTRATPTAQAQAADRLAPIAASAPEQLRAPVGTVLALTEWTLGRDHIHQRLEWATSQGSHPYRLADLLAGLVAAQVPPSTFTRHIAGTLTEQQCRHPNAAAKPTRDPAQVGAALVHAGWGLDVDTQVDLPTGVAWSGTLTHHGHPVASVADHGDGDPPVLYFPPGSDQQQTWDADLHTNGVTPTQAITGLDHHAIHGPPTDALTGAGVVDAEQPGVPHGLHR